VIGVAEGRIAPLVPPRLARGGPRHSVHRNARLDVADLLAGPRSGPLVYGMARIDTWGLVSNRSTIDTLGWTAGDHLHVAVVGGSVVAHRDEAGAFAMGTKPYLMIPAAVRHRSGLRPRDLVLLAADPNHDVLVVHPLAALDTMITADHSRWSNYGLKRSSRTGPQPLGGSKCQIRRTTSSCSAPMLVVPSEAGNHQEDRPWVAYCTDRRIAAIDRHRPARTAHSMTICRTRPFSLVAASLRLPRSATPPVPSLSATTWHRK